MQNNKLVAMLLATSMVFSCTEPNGAPGRGIEHGGALSKQNVGIAAGVLTGGIAGSAIGGGVGNAMAIIGGGLLGGFLGSEIGSSLDRADMQAYNRASQSAMNTGSTKKWRNPDTGHHGTITPHKSYRDRSGRYCREYTQNIYIDGNRHHAYGTACRRRDGSWKIKE